MLKNFGIGFLTILLLTILILMTSSCSSHKRLENRATLYIPRECVDEVHVNKDIRINSKYEVIDKASFSIAYHCTKVVQ